MIKAGEKQEHIQRLHCGPRMSKAVMHGGLVYLSGQTSSGSEAQGITEQTNEVLRRIDDLLAQAGSDRSHMLSALIHLKSMGDFDAMNQCWEAWLSGGPTPARTTVTGSMANDSLLVELTIVAAR
jgi:enamine deaminase RidA (YjgF/YER057c/UK114 family)